MNFKDFGKEIHESLSNPDTLADIARDAFKIARLSGFCAVAGAAEDVRGKEQRIGTGTKVGIVGCIAGTVLGTVAAAKTLESPTE